MKTSSFTYTHPDDDGDSQLAVSTVLTNETQEVVELVMQKMVFYDKAGRPISSNECEHECDINPGESYECVENYCGYIKASLFDGGLENAQLSVSANLCKLYFAISPQFVISTETLVVAGVSDSFSVGEILEVTGISAWLTEPDDDGDFNLEIKSSFRNLTEIAIPKINLKASLFDSRGRSLDNSETDGSLGGNSQGMADISLWGVQNKRLSGSRLQIEVTVFPVIATSEANASGPILKVESDADDNTLPPHPAGPFDDPPATVTNSIGMKLVPVPAGEYLMGSAENCQVGNSDEEFQHKVRITKPFLIGMHQVTQAQYKQVVGKTPSSFKGDEHPVEHLSWQDAVDFCRQLSDLAAEQGSGRKYRLPTEAEWEYACRAGSSTPYNTGDVLRQKDARFAALSRSSRKQTAPVGTYPPNAWGLFDMHGNVWEWTSDWFSASWYHTSPVEDPQGPPSGTHHTLRGGSSSVESHECYSAIRGEAAKDKPEPHNRSIRYALYGDFGMRVVCEISGQAVDRK